MAAMVGDGRALDLVHGKRVPPMFPHTEHRLCYLGYINGGDESDDGDRNCNPEDFVYFRFLLPNPIYKTFVDTKGRHRPVEQLLSYNGMTIPLVRCNTGDRVDFDAAVKGKTLIITCISLPVLTASREMSFCHSIIAAYSDLRDKNCEMVVIPIMKPGFSHKQIIFDNFFNRFPCLGIPFSESDARQFICFSLGGGFCTRDRHKGINTIVLDPQGNVLQHHDATFNFHYYGSLWHPFLDKTVDDLKTRSELCKIKLDPFHQYDKDKFKDHLIQGRPMSLHEDILCCDPSLTLHADDRSKFTTVLDLSKKLVGLYLCFDGGFMGSLYDVHHYCIDKGQQLEIVVVPISGSDDPSTFRKELSKLLQLHNMEQCLCFDSSDADYRRLWRVFGSFLAGDRFVIVPPNCESGELLGDVVIHHLGVEAYPYTRSAIRDERLMSVRSLMPTTWFGNAGKKLTGKKFLLYLPYKEDYGSRYGLYHKLQKYYAQIQEKGWEIACIPLEAADCFTKMPWLTIPFDGALSASVVAKLFLQRYLFDDWAHLIAVGKDGNILSTLVAERLMESGVDESLFLDKLHEDITVHLDVIENWDCV